ncbi:MFS general substrate transporter [Aspergillus undulatus]|uniref:MFS general substrate transporter n=1 Tax=Aspergillus undulatus TaxID=1810928 RepID=UPI003CCD7FA8
MFYSTSHIEKLPGYAWRSSKLFIIIVVSIAMFTDNFLFSFIIPILPDILEGRLRIAPTHTQLFTSIILSMNAIVSIATAPLIGYLSDRVKWKSSLMLSAYAINMVGTAVTAWSTTYAGLIIGRLIQTIAGSFLWIAGMAILGASIAPNQLARAMSICVLFVSAGLLSGPAISAALFNSVPYSLTWLSVFLALLLGTAIQACMLEPYNFPSASLIKKDQDRSGNGQYPACENGQRSTNGYSSQDHDRIHEHEGDEQIPAMTETDPLLPQRRGQCLDHHHEHEQNYNHEHPPHNHAETPASPRAAATSFQIYTMMLLKRRVTTSLVADSLLAVLISSFEATIPLHIKSVFHWESLQAGILFLLLQAPSLILVFPAGWLKDTLGMRGPVTVGFLGLAPLLWVLGVPGSKESGLGWADNRTGQVVYVLTLVGIGACRTLVLGFGGVEVLRGATELADDYPGIFGKRTGHSRAFVLSNVTWKLGMFVGPLASGILTESLGYYWMNVVLAISCAVMGVVTY